MGVIDHRGPGSGGQGAVSLAILETLPPPHHLGLW